MQLGFVTAACIRLPAPAVLAQRDTWCVGTALKCVPYKLQSIERPPPCACPVPFGVVVSGGPKWLPWEMRLWKCILEWKLHLPWLTDGQREVWMCTATSSSPMCLNVSLRFPICLSRTSMQLSPASYPRKKSRNFSIRCMKPTGWCPMHRDASLPASVEPWPFFMRAQLSSGLWERQKVPGVSLHSWHPV